MESNASHTSRRTASIIPNMENVNGFVSNIFAGGLDLNALNEDESTERIEPVKEKKVPKKAKKKRRKHQRFSSVGSPRIELQGKTDNNDDYVYQTWNYEEELSDDLRSDHGSDTKSDEEDESRSDDDELDNMPTFGTERVLSLLFAYLPQKQTQIA